jgi:hypothetical protein
MRNVKVQKLRLVIAMVLLGLCWQGSVTAEKNADDLEEVLIMKLLEKRAKKRGSDDDDRPLRLDKADFKYLKKDDKNDISVAIVNDIKGIIKEPCLNLLASSELISWTELKDRLAGAKKALEMFEFKYRAELVSGGAVATPPVSQQRPVITATPRAVSALPTPVTQTSVSPFGVMPGAKPAVVVAKPPASPAAEEEEEDDDESVKPAVGMPGLKPVGAVSTAPVFAGMPMPVVSQSPKPAGMPGITQPMGMPGLAPTPAFGGMPGIR